MVIIQWYKKYFHILFLVLASIVATLIIPGEGKFKFEYQRGRPWLYETLIAPVDFPVLKSEQELRSERNLAASKSPLCYNLDTEAVLKTREQISKVFNANTSDTLKKIDKLLNYLYEKGIADILEESGRLTGVLVSERGYREFEKPAAEIFTVETAMSYIKERLDLGLESSLKLKAAIKPNFRYNKNATELVRREAISTISPTKGVLYEGQIIAAKGETVTAEIEQLLDSYKEEYEISMGYSGSILMLKFGHFLICSALFLLLYIILYFSKKEVFKEKRKLLFIILLVLLSVLVTVLVRGVKPVYLYVIPYSVFALYLCSFFNTRVVLPVYLVIVLPVVVIAQNGTEIFMINLFAGSITLLAYTYWSRGWMQFAVAFGVFLTLSSSFSAFRMIEDGTILDINPVYFGYFAWNAILIVATYPLIYLFEKFFSLLSNQRLRDLADTENPILAELSQKAPGTFQHVLQVANLAESAVSAIGGYSMLARVGALYHDIGKINDPMLFIENQPAGAVNIHEALDPRDSARLIIKHVQDGVEISKREKLPAIINEFIQSHHGKSKTLYFYNKYLNNGGNPSDEDIFTYDGIFPRYREQVVVMMADAVEAASRSLKNYNEESISELVERVVGERVKDDQLSEAEISLKEIRMVKDVFKQRLSGMYHSRMVKPV
ncbi:MAG: HDIG domain-containing protein [Bacteroidales bacterium]|jgi:putative nucleotidyltransferase with HDIG domain|nr:HDIG domain-containing protein [Bacteroidales bacterium]MDD4058354.1 HDIG domain-containing protein [Bacteroidales bacterium]